jgi:hypothetical protein
VHGLDQADFQGNFLHDVQEFIQNEQFEICCAGKVQMPLFRVTHALDELFVRNEGLVKVAFKSQGVPHVNVLVIVRSDTPKFKMTPN